MTTPITSSSSQLEGSLKDSAVARLLLGQKLSDADDRPSRQRSALGRQLCRRKVETGHVTRSPVNVRQARNCFPGRREIIPAGKDLNQSAQHPAVDLSNRRISEHQIGDGLATDKFNRMISSIQQTVETLRSVIASELERLRRYSPPAPGRDPATSEPVFCQLCQYSTNRKDLGKQNTRDAFITHYRQHESQLIGNETSLDSNTVFGWFNYYIAKNSASKSNAQLVPPSGAYMNHSTGRRSNNLASKSRYTIHSSALTVASSTAISTTVSTSEGSMAVLKELLLRPSSRAPARLEPATNVRQRSTSLVKVPKLSLSPTNDSVVVRSASAHGDLQGFEIRPLSEEGTSAVEPHRLREGTSLMAPSVIIKQEPPSQISSPTSSPRNDEDGRNEAKCSNDSNINFTPTTETIKYFSPRGEEMYENGCLLRCYKPIPSQNSDISSPNAKYNIDDIIRNNIAKCNAEIAAGKFSRPMVSELQSRDDASCTPSRNLMNYRQGQCVENRNESNEVRTFDKSNVSTSKRSLDCSARLELPIANAVACNGDRYRSDKADMNDEANNSTSEREFEKRKRESLTRNPEDIQKLSPTDMVSTSTYRHKRFGTICAPSIEKCSEESSSVAWYRNNRDETNNTNLNDDKALVVERLINNQRTSVTNNSLEESKGEYNTIPQLQHFNSKEVNRNDDQLSGHTKTVQIDNFANPSKGANTITKSEIFAQDETVQSSIICRPDCGYDVRIASCPLYASSSSSLRESEIPCSSKSPLRNSNFVRSCSDSNVIFSYKTLSDDHLHAERFVSHVGTAAGRHCNSINSTIVSARCKSIDSQLYNSMNNSNSVRLQSPPKRLSQLESRNLMQKFLDERIPRLLHQSKQEELEDDATTEGNSILHLRDTKIYEDELALRQLRLPNCHRFGLNRGERSDPNLVIRRDEVADPQMCRTGREICKILSNEIDEEKTEVLRNINGVATGITERMTFEVVPQFSASERAMHHTNFAKSIMSSMPETCLLRSEPHSSFVHGKLPEHFISTGCETIDYQKMLQIIASRCLSKQETSDNINERKRKSTDDTCNSGDDGTEGVKRLRTGYENISTISELYDQSIENFLKQRYSETSSAVRDNVANDITRTNSYHDSLSEATGSLSESRTPATSRLSPASNQTNDSTTNGYDTNNDIAENNLETGVKCRLIASTEQNISRCLSVSAQKNPSLAFNISSLISSTNSEDLCSRKTVDYNATYRSNNISNPTAAFNPLVKVLHSGPHSYNGHSDGSVQDSGDIPERPENFQQMGAHEITRANLCEFYKRLSTPKNDNENDIADKREKRDYDERNIQNSVKYSEQGIPTISDNYSSNEPCSSVTQISNRSIWERIPPVNSSQERIEERSNHDSGSFQNAMNSRTCCDYTGRRCEPCGITFDDEVLHSIHMGCHSHLGPYVCNLCSKHCANRYGFNTHIMRGHHPV